MSLTSASCSPSMLTAVAAAAAKRDGGLFGATLTAELAATHVCLPADCTRSSVRTAEKAAHEGSPSAPAAPALTLSLILTRAERPARLHTAHPAPVQVQVTPHQTGGAPSLGGRGHVAPCAASKQALRQARTKKAQNGSPLPEAHAPYPETPTHPVRSPNPL
jgi:hypothetical protein